MLFEPSFVNDIDVNENDVVHFCSVDLVDSPMRDAHYQLITKTLNSPASVKLTKANAVFASFVRYTFDTSTPILEIVSTMLSPNASLPNITNANLKDVQTFTKQIGGAPCNVACTVQKLGQQAHMITQLGRKCLNIF
jgi:sugar/nucleoside kinase (ribokinase family)